MGCSSKSRAPVRRSVPAPCSSVVPSPLRIPHDDGKDRCAGRDGGRGFDTAERAGSRCYRWFLRGFANSVSLALAFTFLSARFSRIDFPGFFEPTLLGDFPDTEITTFPPRYLKPYALIFFKPVRLIGSAHQACQRGELLKRF